MLKFRYYFRFFKAFVVRFRAILAIGIALGMVFFLALGFAAPRFFSQKIERIGYTGRYTSDALPQEILHLIGNGLTKVNESGNVAGELSSSWEYTEDGKIWIFHLDDKKTWQDGKPVTSDAINYSFDQVKIEKPDSKTINFILKEKFAPFPSVVSKPIFKKGLLGTGTWKVTKLSLVGNYVEYMNLEDKDKNKKIIKFYPTEERTKIAFQLGEIDRIEDILDPEPLSSWKTAALTGSVVSNRYVAVFFNMQDVEFNDNDKKDKKAFRQALTYAIDKEALSQNRALGPISPNSWAFNSQIKSYDYDPKRAKELLADIPKAEREKISLKLTTTSNLIKQAEKIAKNWSDIGIKTTVSVVTGIPSDYQAFLATYDSPYDPDQYVTWHSSQMASNISKYASPRIDKLLEDGRLELSQNERRKIYLDFQRYLLEDDPAAFLYHPTSYTITRK